MRNTVLIDFIGLYGSIKGLSNITYQKLFYLSPVRGGFLPTNIASALLVGQPETVPFCFYYYHMQFNDEELEEFQKLYKDRFGEEISKVQALQKAIKLVNLLKIVYRPIKKSE